jgi:hypothetical protein
MTSDFLLHPFNISIAVARADQHLALAGETQHNPFATGRAVDQGAKESLSCHLVDSFLNEGRMESKKILVDYDSLVNEISSVLRNLTLP